MINNNPTPEEIEAYREKKWNDDFEHREIYIRLKDIRKKISKNQIELYPQWHLDLNDIELTNQRECLINHNSINDYELIPSVQIDLLFEKMMPWIVKIFKKRKLFTRDWNDWKNSEVIHNWTLGTKLIPPTITIEKDCQLFPIEGKHRINVANYFNATEIPILIPKEDSCAIKERLGIIKHFL